MLVSDPHRFVFLWIPKTGTRSIHKLLVDEYQGRLLGDHKHVIPEEYGDYYKWTVVRNPYDRMYSLYWSCCRKVGDVKGFVSDMHHEGFDNTITGFLRWIIRHQDRFMYLNESKYLILKSQVAFFTNQIDRVIYYEELSDGLGSLPFMVNPSIERLNESNYSHVVMSATDIRLINQYCHEEFSLLGYDMLT